MPKFFELVCASDLDRCKVNDFEAYEIVENDKMLEIAIERERYWLKYYKEITTDVYRANLQFATR